MLYDLDAAAAVRAALSGDDRDAAAALRAVHKVQTLVSARSRDLRLAFDDAMAAGEWERAREIAADCRRFTAFFRLLSVRRRRLWMRVRTERLALASPQPSRQE